MHHLLALLDAIVEVVCTAQALVHHLKVVDEGLLEVSLVID